MKKNKISNNKISQENASNYKKADILTVLGMHRSGTSAITRGLLVLGVDLGNNLYGVMPGVNDKGFWEDIDLNTLDVEMLDALGTDWHHASFIQQEHVEILRKRGYFLQAAELLRKKVNDNLVFGFKDPRVSKLLPFWKEVFRHCKFSVDYIIAIRNPLSIARSLAKRDGFESEKSYLIWLNYVLTALLASCESKRIVVDYDLLMQSPEYQIARLAEYFNLDINTRELEVYKNEFLDKDLRHSVYNADDLLLDENCPPLVIEVYSLLLDLATDKIQFDDSIVQEKIQIWFNELNRLDSALRLLDRLSMQKIEALQKISIQNSELSGLNQLSLNQKDQIADLNQVLQSRDHELADLNQVLQSRDHELTDFKHEVMIRDTDITRLKEAAIAQNWQLVKLARTINEILDSTSWRLTRPMRTGVTTIRKAHSVWTILPHILQKGGGLFPTLYSGTQIFKNEGIEGVKARVRFIFFKSKEKKTSQKPAISGLLDAPRKLAIVPYYIDPIFDSIEASINIQPSIAIHLHLYYSEMLDEFAGYLNNIPVEYDLYVSVKSSSNKRKIKAKFKRLLLKARNIVVESVPNRGRDLAPMIIQFGKRLVEYEIIAHIHSKKSIHNNNLTEWRRDILSKLLGSTGSSGGRIAHFIELLQTTANVVYPEGQSGFIKDSSGRADNHELAKKILEKYTYLTIDDYPVVEFPEGSMFWANAKCLRTFLELPLSYNDFPIEPISADGTLAHVLERLILVFANQQDRVCIRIHERDSIKDYQQYEEQRDYSTSILHKDVKILSYYLPQFHPIPENDIWHGKGFTEWTKVRSANPLFLGHYQQHIPHSDIGYYLLDTIDTLKKQADQMKKAGVYGQVFYHYWFTGKLILEEPAQLLLNSPDIEMPYCFCWANENWTRSWDGNENEILLDQKYSTYDAYEFIQYLIPFFKDPRYITIDHRPVLFIYRPSSIPNAVEYQEIWSKECLMVGINPPYVVAVLTRGATNPNHFGMDAGVERVLHDWTDGAVPNIKDSLVQYWPVNGSVLDYNKVVEFYTSQVDEKDFIYFRSTVPIWDNTARYGSEAYLLHGSSPQRFQEWMKNTITYTQEKLPVDKRIIVVNAWNEWAEGAHLEPDSRYGYSYLNSIGRVLSDIAYEDEINPNYLIPADIKVHILFPKYLLDKLSQDEDLKHKFLFCLSRQSIINVCRVSVDIPDLLAYLPVEYQPNYDDAEVIIEFRQIALFNDTVIEKMVQTAFATGSVVIPNSYDGKVPIYDVSGNGSIDSSVVHKSPIVIFKKKSEDFCIKNCRMRTDARCIEVYPSTILNSDKPIVTTIIRFHKSADLNELENALYCLSAMMQCIVQPFIAAQDLSPEQIINLEKLLQKIPWVEGYSPLVDHYKSLNGTGDLRSKMLNESLKKVKSQYAAFLDFDDLLLPYAYGWLINRLKLTGKAVAFGRVYATNHTSKDGRLVDRTRLYEYGYSYEEFLDHNHAPLHSFILDLGQLDLSNIIYFDDQKYMEDYLLTLQLFSKENADWEGLKSNFYIGDYIHSVDREHTLALTNEQERLSLLESQEYIICDQRICDIRNKIKNSTGY